MQSAKKSPITVMGVGAVALSGSDVVKKLVVELGSEPGCTDMRMTLPAGSFKSLNARICPIVGYPLTSIMRPKCG